MKNKSIFEDWFGIKPRIPIGFPWLSPTGGARLSEEVLQAMHEAGKYKVDQRALLIQAGRTVADLIGAEAAFITSGGSAALTLAAAAVMTGKDLTKMRQLPETDYPIKLRNEFIVQVGTFPAYLTSLRVAGGKIIWAGSKGAERNQIYDPELSIRKAMGIIILPEDIEEAITERTAGIIAAVPTSKSVPPPLTVPIEDIVKIAQKHNIPTIVDSSHLPTSGGKRGQALLKKYLDMGVDLVCTSCGKAMEAPNNTGLVYGRKDLVEAAAPQGTSAFPLNYESSEFPEYPKTRSELIGRGFKVSKEQIVGLVAALKRYLAMDDQAVTARDMKLCNWMADQFRDFPHVKAIGVVPESDWPNDNMHEGGPSCVLEIDEQALNIRITDLNQLMLTGEPPAVEMAGCDVLAPWKRLQLFSRGVKDGEEKIVIEKLKNVLCSGLETKPLSP